MTPRKSTQRITVAGLAFDDLSMEEAVTRILGLAGVGGMVVTPNLDHLMRAEKDPALRSLYLEADVSLADGMPVTWLASIHGHRLERVPGSALFVRLCAEAANRGYRVAVVGMPDHSAADELRGQLTASFPDIDALCISPPFGFEHSSNALSQLASELGDFEPHIVFACLGSPKQEKWAHLTRESLPRAVFIGAGASALFFTGTLKRPPEWMQRIGLEWFGRLLTEPTRLWRRYAKNFHFLLKAITRELCMKARGRS